VVAVLFVLRQQADQAYQPEQANQVPNEIALRARGRSAILCFGWDAPALGLGGGWACRGRNQEQREYQTPVHGILLR
jgi:hypothetical protein